MKINRIVGNAKYLATIALFAVIVGCAKNVPVSQPAAIPRVNVEKTGLAVSKASEKSKSVTVQVSKLKDQIDGAQETGEGLLNTAEKIYQEGAKPKGPVATKLKEQAKGITDQLAKADATAEEALKSQSETEKALLEVHSEVLSVAREIAAQNVHISENEKFTSHVVGANEKLQKDYDEVKATLDRWSPLITAAKWIIGIVILVVILNLVNIIGKGVIIAKAPFLAPLLKK